MGQGINSHDLARKLLELPNLPISVSANNHEAFSTQDTFKVGLANHYSGLFIIIGNMESKDLNMPNWYIEEFYE